MSHLSVREINQKQITSKTNFGFAPEMFSSWHSCQTFFRTFITDVATWAVRWPGYKRQGHKGNWPPPWSIFLPAGGTTSNKPQNATWTPDRCGNRVFSITNSVSIFLNFSEIFKQFTWYYNLFLCEILDIFQIRVGSANWMKSRFRYGYCKWLLVYFLYLKMQDI